MYISLTNIYLNKTILFLKENLHARFRLDGLLSANNLNSLL